MDERYEEINGSTTNYNEKVWAQSWLCKCRLGFERTIAPEIPIPKHEEVFWY